MKLIKIITLNLILFFTGLVLSDPNENSKYCPNLLDHELRVLDSNKTENLCKYKDKVILAVNVASRCGYTPQYEGLQSLWSEYKDKNLQALLDAFNPNPVDAFGSAKAELDLAKENLRKNGVLIIFSLKTKNNKIPSFRVMKSKLNKSLERDQN